MIFEANELDTYVTYKNHLQFCTLSVSQLKKRGNFLFILSVLGCLGVPVDYFKVLKFTKKFKSLKSKSDLN